MGAFTLALAAGLASTSACGGSSSAVSPATGGAASSSGGATGGTTSTGGRANTGGGGGSSNAAFELDGAWTYLGPSDGPHDLTIGHGSMVFKDVGGTWSSNWTIKTYDDALHHFQIEFVSGTGTYLPTGKDVSATYDLAGSLLSIQSAAGVAYPTLQGAGSCTDPADGTPLPECRLYIKAN